MAKKSFRLWSLFSLLIVSINASAINDESRCPNCEVIVELDAVKAEQFASRWQFLSAMPLHGIVIDSGSSSSLAKVVVATSPTHPAGGNSFDVAKHVLDFAKGRPEYTIKSITAVWNSDL